MRPYQQRLAALLAESGSLFFRSGLRLKDGRPTPYFVNLGVFRTGRLALELGRCFADWMKDQGLHQQVDVLLGPSYKGSAIAQATAIALYQEHGVDLAFEYDRKEAKTHGEASGGGNLFVTGALDKGSRVLILDDVGTSMATKVELLDKVKAEDARRGLGLKIQGVALAVDREQVQAVYDAEGKVVQGGRGADALADFTAKTGLKVWALLGMRQAFQWLHSQGLPVLVEGVRQPLGEALMQQVGDYLAIYGREGRP
jgi:orotate phosphoribosyltransferase